jgi:CTP:molybdopterin cytidylyltransferase MocA
MGETEQAGGSTSAILLAAGVSRRMGTLKALLDWGGRPLIIHQIVALREAGADEVVVVLGHRGDELQARIGANREVYQAGAVHCAHNPDFASGKTTSIKAGLQAIGGSAAQSGTILMLNVDQPRSAGIIRRVLDAHRSADGAVITIPTCRGKGGHPNVLSRSLLPELLEIDEATQGMRAVTQQHQAATQRVELGAVELLWDVNTPEQYRATLAAAGLPLPDNPPAR